MPEKRIWREEVTLDALNLLAKGTMLEHVDIKFIEIGDDYLQATMPVDHRTTQPAGLLHGGASAVLAETLGSVASYLCIDRSKYYAVGLNIVVHHISAVTEGIVTGTVRPIHLGGITHVWDIQLVNSKNKIVSVSKLTMIVLSAERMKQNFKDSD